MFSFLDLEDLGMSVTVSCQISRVLSFCKHQWWYGISLGSLPEFGKFKPLANPFFIEFINKYIYMCVCIHIIYIYMEVS